ncbi:MAG: hypothetical protein K9G65_01470, partial [Rickettsiaceae bacterium]|nr:hypothetical protein [Rickettsiaceae bacterium]
SSGVLTNSNLLSFMTYLLLLVMFFQNFQQDTSPNSFCHTPLLTIALAATVNASKPLIPAPIVIFL